jgi:hypothetical protein
MMDVTFNEETHEQLPAEIQGVLHKAIVDNFRLKAQAEAIEAQIKEVKGTVDKVMENFHLRNISDPEFGGYTRAYTERNSLDQGKLRAAMLRKGMSAADVNEVIGAAMKTTSYWSVSFRLPGSKPHER